jgi:hypothetical protein
MDAQCDAGGAMKNTHPTTPTTASASTPEPSSLGSRACRTDSVLRPTTPLEVLVSRALEAELHWWYAYGESALSRDDVGILPSYAAARLLGPQPSDDACRARGHELARTVRGCLHAMSARHASVLRAAFTPRRWPKAVENAFDVLAPIAVRLAFAEDPWPPRLSAHTGLEEAAACRLSAALHDPAKVKVGKLKTQAQRLLGNAVAAYAKARASALVPTLGVA